MSTRRIGELPPHRKDRGPNGRALCRLCGKEVGPRRQSWCSNECRGEATARAYPSAARWAVFDRDGGICADCGLDCHALDEALYEWRHMLRMLHWDRTAAFESLGKEPPAWDRTIRLFEEAMRSLGLGVLVTDMSSTGLRSSWEVDHILPVSEGGGETGLANLRTLCWRCHRAETAGLARRRADTRRGQTCLPLTKAS